MEKLHSVLPTFYDELIYELSSLGLNQISDQMPDIFIKHYVSHREDEQSIYLYTVGVRDLNSFEKSITGLKDEERIELNNIDGTIAVYTDSFDRVMGIEILNRPDIYSKLESSPVNLADDKEVNYLMYQALGIFTGLIIISIGCIIYFRGWIEKGGVIIAYGNYKQPVGTVLIFFGLYMTYKFLQNYKKH